MATTGDVHVGDIGTLYKMKIQDQGVAFDPSLATVKKLIWKPPAGAAIVERTATVVHEGSDWYLTYTVTNAEPTFHVKGKYHIQGYVEFAGGERYHTGTEEYTVVANLN